MTYTLYSYKCSKCGKTSAYYPTGWVRLEEQSCQGEVQENSRYFCFCPKCRAEVLGPLTKYTIKTKIEEIPGWTYTKAEDLTWEPRYQEDVFVTGLYVDGSGIETMPSEISWAVSK